MEPPPPDPLTPGQTALYSAAVCAGSCAANGVGLFAGLTGRTPLLIPAGPVFGLVGASVGGALAEVAAPEPETTALQFSQQPPQPPPDSQAAWGAFGAATGYLLLGGVAATVGYFVGAPLSQDAPLVGGGFGALGFGAVGGAVGAGIGTFIVLSNEPP